MQVLFTVLMFIFGATLGSFLCCQAQRLHLREQGKKVGNSRSICLHCHHQLAWYENIPLISWLAQKGKCRHCHRKIGIAELLSEFGVAVSFALLSTTINIATATPMEWIVFSITLLLTLALCFLAIYDGKWGELPTPILIFAIILAVIVAGIRLWSEFFVAGFYWQPILETIGAVVILSGLYLLLYLVSRGRWVGDGDWLLGLCLGLALGSPWLALCTLFIANFSACLVMYPVIRRRRTKKIHFGPFLALAFILVAAFSTQLLALLTF